MLARIRLPSRVGLDLLRPQRRFTPAEGQLPGGNCGMASTNAHKVPAARLLTMLFGPGLLLARPTWPIRRIRHRKIGRDSRLCQR